MRRPRAIRRRHMTVTLNAGLLRLAGLRSGGRHARNAVQRQLLRRLARTMRPDAPTPPSYNRGMLRQRTLKSQTRAIGVGLHGGQRVEITLRPAPPDTGIVFRRIDLPTPVDIPMSALAVSDTRMATTASSGNAKVATVEHLMSACAGLGIDNLIVDITAEEVPILDGSAASFLFLLQNAGVVWQEAPRRFIRVLRTVEIRDGATGAQARWARLEPYHGFRLNFEIVFDHPAVDSTGQRVSFDMGSGSYARDIARARTFGFTRDVETMRVNGLALGGGLDNAIVMDDYKILNAEGLRYDDEFAKHKILDAIGDLYMLGHPLLASYSAYRSGHELNNRLARALMAQTDAWEWAQFDDAAQAPAGFAQLAPAW